MPRAVFASSVFLGAFLVFQIQPLIGKYVLPWYGGTAAVWTTCLLVFQALLFAGYAYAHLLSRLAPRPQCVVHVALLGLAAAIPVLPAEAWKPAGGESPLLRIVAMLLATVGLPYFALSAGGPLLQSWFWRVEPGRSPYPLYALSNAGSLLALLSYPVVVEPYLSGRRQAALWRWGFAAFVVLAAAGAWLTWRGAPRPPRSAPPPDAETAPPPSWGRMLEWTGWSACSVILFMSVTNQLTLNVASVPFLWVVPLSLYLLAFIVAFSGERAYPRPVFGALLVAAVAAIVAVLELDLGYAGSGGFALPILPKIAVYCVALFVLCMVCHGELYRSRPAPRHLTRFYLAIAFGGMLGGILVGAVAPLLFLLYQELQLGLLLCCALYLAGRLRDPTSPLCLDRRRWAAAVAALGLVALALATARQTWLQLEGAVSTRRNFFGLLRVQEVAPDDPARHAFRLFDGAIVHGYQFQRADLRHEPTTYYARLTGVGRVLQLRQRAGPLRVGVVGLGAGTLAAYGRRGDSFRFYEINPAVVEVARDGFTYLADSPAETDVVLGDARLSLEREPPQRFDFLVLDAFSSDAIPVHLLTLEAFEIYERHLAPGAVIAVNVSNLHLELSTILYRIAEQRHMHALEIRNHHLPQHLTMAAEWMVLSRDTEFMNELLAVLEPPYREGELQLGNRPPERHAAVRAWTDESSSLLQILK